MSTIYWDNREGRWRGICPRCNHQTYFELKHRMDMGVFAAETLFCPGGHGIYLEYITNDPSKEVRTCCPIDYSHKTPDWLPDEYKPTYKELLEAKSIGHGKSVVALCAVLLEAHVNGLIRNPGEKKKSLFDRLEILKTQGTIDVDQFTNATITRITRNDVLHPADILSEISDDEMKVIFDEITSYLERAYRFRSSRALPEPQADEESIEEIVQE